MRHCTRLLAVLAAFTLAPTTALAQDAPSCDIDAESIKIDDVSYVNVECIQEQAKLSGEAQEAYVNKDYEEAARIYENLVRVQPLNLYHLNLGRTYQKLNQCFLAREQYEKAVDSKKGLLKGGVPVVTPGDVVSTVTRFRSQMKEQDTCFGRVEPQCDPLGMTLDYTTLDYVKGEDGSWSWQERAVTGDVCQKDTALIIPPGKQTLCATYAGETLEVEITSEAYAKTLVPITIELKKDEPKDPVIKDPVVKDPVATKDPEKGDPVRDGLNPKPDDKNTTVNANVTVNVDNTRKPNPAAGWTLLGVGTAIILTGLVYDTCMFGHGGLQTRVDGAVNGSFNDGGLMCNSGSVSRNGAGGYTISGDDCLCAGVLDRRVGAEDMVGPVAYLLGGILSIAGATRF